MKATPSAQDPAVGIAVAAAVATPTKANPPRWEGLSFASAAGDGCPTGVAPCGRRQKLAAPPNLGDCSAAFASDPSDSVLPSLGHCCQPAAAPPREDLWAAPAACSPTRSIIRACRKTAAAGCPSRGSSAALSAPADCSVTPIPPGGREVVAAPPNRGACSADLAGGPTGSMPHGSDRRRRQAAAPPIEEWSAASAGRWCTRPAPPGRRRR